MRLCGATWSAPYWPDFRRLLGPERSYPLTSRRARPFLRPLPAVPAGRRGVAQLALQNRRLGVRDPPPLPAHAGCAAGRFAL
jgi:hypothetical protein